MNLNYSANSLEAYLIACKNKNEKRILEYIKDCNVLCAREIGLLTDLPDNIVSGRINDLRHKQILIIDRKAKYLTSGRIVNFYKIKSDSDENNTFNEGVQIDEKLANILNRISVENTIIIPTDYIIINKKRVKFTQKTLENFAL